MTTNQSEPPNGAATSEAPRFLFKVAQAFLLIDCGLMLHTAIPLWIDVSMSVSYSSCGVQTAL